jgi:serine/threonine protein kinase
MEGMNYLFLSLEFFDGCTLEKLIDGKSDKKFFFEEPIIIKIVKELLEAINYIHKNEIYHRDIKPENILIKINPKNQEV